MRRRTRLLLLAGLLLAAGCGRSGAYEFELPGDTPGPTPTASPTPTPVIPAAEQCPVPDASLVGCWTLDGNFTDGSAQAHVASATNVGFAGGISGQAGALAANSYFNVPSSGVFNLSAMTVESWIRVPTLPSAGNKVTSLHRPPTLRMDVLDDGSVECVFDGDEVVSSQPALIAANTWTHIACTFDPNTDKRVWVGGSVAGQNGADGGPDPSTSDLRIGSTSGGADNFVGNLDVIRVWNRVFTAAEMCEAAGLNPGC